MTAFMQFWTWNGKGYEVGDLSLENEWTERVGKRDAAGFLVVVPLGFRRITSRLVSRRIPKRTFCRLSKVSASIRDTWAADWVKDGWDALGYGGPTQVQAECFERLLSRNVDTIPDVVIQAETGSGKTLAYLVPLLSELELSRSSTQAIIVAPTDELVLQIAAVVSGFAKGMINSNSLVLPLLSVTEVRRQKQMLKTWAPRVVVGTPSRVAVLIRTARLSLNGIRTLVVDEFDVMLVDDDVTSSLQNILSSQPTRESRRGMHSGALERRTMLVSATVPQRRQFLKRCLKERWTRPGLVHIHVQKSSDVMPCSLTHEYILVPTSEEKFEALRSLNEMDCVESALIFIQSSRSLNEVMSKFSPPLGKVLWIDDASSVGAVQRALRQLNRGRNVFLFCSDRSSRGLDLGSVSHVINLDLPESPEVYVHRAGRAGRMGRPGSVISVASEGEAFALDRLANALGIELRESLITGSEG